MAYSYSQLQDIKSRVVRDLAAQQTQLTTAKGAFAAVATALGGMQTAYAGWAGEVNTLVTANPNNDAIKALKAERDLLVDEFAASKTEAETLNTLVNG